jgi:cytochrome c biogenesis protein CcmG/thiol:disulfide interchange protein DsbE
MTESAPPATDAAPQEPAPEERPGRRRRRWLGVLLLVALVAATGGVLAVRLGGGGTAPAALVGQHAPALRGTTLDGTAFDLADWRGSPVLVNLWGSWCGPCRDELPLLADADSALAPHGLRMVGIDVRDPAGSATSFLAGFPGVSWPSVTDPGGERAVDWGALGLPETYLVDRNGTVVAKSVGVVTPAWIDRYVVPLLEKEKSR